MMEQDDDLAFYDVIEEDIRSISSEQALPIKKKLVKQLCVQLDQFMAEGRAKDPFQARRRQAFLDELHDYLSACERSRPSHIKYAFLYEKWRQLQSGWSWLQILTHHDFNEFEISAEFSNPLAAVFERSKSELEPLDAWRPEYDNLTSPAECIESYFAEFGRDENRSIHEAQAKKLIVLHAPATPFVVTSKAETPSEDVAVRREADPSFSKLLEEFISSQKGWPEKYKRQHRLVGELFVKFVGSDDCRDMTQQHVVGFFQILHELPKSHGKSSKDAELNLDEILAKGRAAQQAAEKEFEALKKKDPFRTIKPPELLGLAPPTINRYISQLAPILKFCRMKGYPICDLDTLSNLRERDPEDQDEKREAFSLDECKKIFESPNWNGCASFDNRIEPGNIVVHDALYWAPLIAYYSMARLSEVLGLMINDIDMGASVPFFAIRPNAIRPTVKTPKSKRKMPLHPELLRLGFRDYVQSLKQAKQVMVFPELRERGTKTELSSLFNKEWVKILDHQLPNARNESKTFHSFRHTGNTNLTGEIEDSVRNQLMGHTATDINGKVYLKELPVEKKYKAILNLQVVTEHIEPRPIQLSPLMRKCLKPAARSPHCGKPTKG